MEFFYEKDLSIIRIQDGDGEFQKHQYHIATATNLENAIFLCKLLKSRAQDIKDLEAYQDEYLAKIDTLQKKVKKLQRKGRK